MSDLQAELSDKRKKLAELRAKRAEQGGASAASPAANTGAAPSTAAPLSANERLRLMREQRAQKEIAAASPGSQSAGATASSPPRRPNPADMVNRLAGVSQAEVARVQRASRAPLKTVCPDRLQWDVAPQGKADHYEKQAQTDPVEQEIIASPVGSPRRPDFRKVVCTVAAGSGQEQPKEEAPAEKNLDTDEKVDLGDVAQACGLSMEERDRIMSGTGCRQFVRDASYLVERALADSDWLMPCEAESGEAVTMGGSGDTIVRRLTLSDRGSETKNKGLTKNSPVTSVDFCSSFGGNPELVVASYYKRSEDTSITADVEGSVLVWSMRVTDRPFQQLRAPCDVAKAIYCKYNGNLVLGAMYNGQVCMWDTREGAKPVQVSPLTTGHTYPVFGIEVVGTTNSHQLVTLSSDGKLCTWQMEKLAVPTDSYNLTLSMDVMGATVSREVGATSLGFRDMDTSKFFIGSDDGKLFAGNRGGSNRGLECQSLEGQSHTSPITSLHCHPVNPGSHEDFGDLILTSSMDWTCKLWMPTSSPNRYLFSFDEHTDFVYDARWSPEHPSVFASVDGSGYLSVYHLGESMETPLAKGLVSTERPRACSCLSWTGDGRFIGVGSAAGDISIWQVSQRVAEPHESDWKKLREKLGKINKV